MDHAGLVPGLAHRSHVSRAAAGEYSPAAYETEAQEVKPNGANTSKTSLVPDTTNPCGRGWEWTPGDRVQYPAPGASVTWTMALTSRVQSSSWGSRTRFLDPWVGVGCGATSRLFFLLLLLIILPVCHSVLLGDFL